jgi:hypothetical protein
MSMLHHGVMRGAPAVVVRDAVFLCLLWFWGSGVYEKLITSRDTLIRAPLGYNTYYFEGTSRLAPTPTAGALFRATVR